MQPFLAESIEVSEDGREYVFRLRDEVRFHNGDVMTAEDVAANFARVQDNVEGGWLASAMDLVDSFEATDSRTFVVHMSEPYAPFLNLLSELWILSPESPGWEDQISEPIGTGPFEFGEWAPGVRLFAPAHEGYWREGLPHLEAVEFQPPRGSRQGACASLRRPPRRERRPCSAARAPRRSEHRGSGR